MLLRSVINITYAALLLASAAPCQAADKESLRKTYNLRFLSTSPENQWTPEELTAIDGLLQSLPEELATIGKSLPRVHVSKTYKGKRIYHAGPKFLHWQIEINLRGFDRGVPHADVRDRMYRQLIHGLLHLYDNKHHISESQVWRSISGWRRFELLGFELPLMLEESSNHNPEAYAGPTGMESAAEDFASFGEQFFLPHQTTAANSQKCRNPSKYRFLQGLFPGHVTPLEKAGYNCIDPGAGFLDDIVFFDPVSEQQIDLGPVNEETVSGFELLYATPGVNDAAEIAGHLVLRVKLNNHPELNDGENPRDLVISFLADTAEGEAPRSDAPPAAECKDGIIAGVLGGLPAANQRENPWDGITQALRGLSGGFLTTFDRQTLDQTILSYTGLQDRNLLRYELLLTPEQKRSLIERLYLAKLNYKTKYYFFDRNCASILVQVIGEGIRDRRIAEFDPFVIPPNSLIALMRRHDLARPVYPAFYSYKRRAQIAQETIKRLLVDLATTDDRAKAIDPNALFDRDAKTRDATYAKIFAMRDLPTSRSAVYRIAQLAQEAEQEFLDRERRCENYTSDATARARQAQRAMIMDDPDIHRLYAVNTNEMLDQSYAGREADLSTRGSPHTKLISFGVGVGAYIMNGDQETSHSIRGALFRQDMGDRTFQSMQRATAVKLVDIDVALTSQTGEMREASLTGLHVRKFKERLDAVPSYVSNTGKIGLGLAVANFVGSDLQSDLEWGRGELLANIVSSHAYDKHLYLHLGATAESRWGSLVGSRENSIGVPMGISALYTAGRDRRWQFRVSHERRYSILPGSPYRETASAQISTMFGRPFAGEGIAGARYRGVRYQNPHLNRSGSSDRIEMFVEWNRW